MWISIFLFQTTSKIDNILSTRVFLVDGSKLKTRLARPIACESTIAGSHIPFPDYNFNG